MCLPLASQTTLKAGSRISSAFGFLPLMLLGPTLNPLEILAKTFDQHRRNPLEMVQVKRPFFESDEVSLRVAVDSERRMRVDVLRPLIHQGVVSVDDGKELRTLYPDSRRIVIQQSPLTRKVDNEGRLKLVRTNYLLEADPGPRVAGRSTYQISLTPKNKGVPYQAILVDQDKMTPLRIIAEDDARGEQRVLLDTVFVKFGAPKESIKFAIEPDKESVVQRAWGPVYISDLAPEAERLGFRPHIPKKLPYGFIVNSLALQGSKERPFLTVNVSDGILSSNLFLWSRLTHGKANPISRDPLFERDGVFFAVYGDAPPHLARTLLSSFVIEKKLQSSDLGRTGNTSRLAAR